ncbi:hypothetical protein IWW57_003653, partial [Coemansia sp. S610]
STCRNSAATPTAILLKKCEPCRSQQTWSHSSARSWVTCGAPSMKRSSHWCLVLATGLAMMIWTHCF